MKFTRTQKQDEIAARLASEFDIDADRILFLNPDKPEEPWLSAEALVTIARRSGNFQAIDETFNQYIAPLNQVVHSATVVDKDGRSYTRSGVATIGEREEVDDHTLAAGRAVGAALTAAGFNPLRPGGVVSIHQSRQQAAGQSQADPAQSRNTDLKRIHALAVEKGLIKTLPGDQRDMVEYRKALKANYGVTSAAGFDVHQRASLINYLEQLPDVDEFADVDEFKEVA